MLILDDTPRLAAVFLYYINSWKKHVYATHVETQRNYVEDEIELKMLKLKNGDEIELKMLKLKFQML
jgi:phosphotransferase system HPr-like phosphotransfer protein